MATKVKQPKSNSTSNLYSKIYDAIFEHKLLPWQRDRLKEIQDMPPQNYYTLVCPRRNGKTEISLAVILAYLLGGYQVHYSAQSERTALKIYQRFLKAFRAANISVRPNTSRAILELPEFHGMCAFTTRGTGTAVGDYADLVIFDEAQDLRAYQWADMSPIIDTSPVGKILVLGTPPRETAMGDMLWDIKEEVIAGTKHGKIYGVKEFIPNPTSKDWSNPEVNPSFGKLLKDKSFERNLTGGIVNFNVDQLGYFMPPEELARLRQPYVFEKERVKLKKFQNPPQWKPCASVIAMRHSIATGQVALVKVSREKPKEKTHIQALGTASISAGLRWVVDLLLKNDFDQFIYDSTTSKVEIAQLLKIAGIGGRISRPSSAADYLACSAEITQAVEKGELQTHQWDLWKRNLSSYSEVIMPRGGRKIDSDDPEIEALNVALGLALPALRIKISQFYE